MRFLKPFFWLGFMYDRCTYASHSFTSLFHVTPVNLKVSTQLERLNSDRQCCYATTSKWLLPISASPNIQDLTLCAQHRKLCKIHIVYNTTYTPRGIGLLNKRCMLCVPVYLIVMHEQMCIIWQCLSVNLLNWRALMILLASKRVCSTNFATWLIWWWSYWESGKLTAFIPCINILCARVSCSCWYKKTIASYILSSVSKIAANLCADQWNLPPSIHALAHMQVQCKKL